jgi:hypothetical protein
MIRLGSAMTGGGAGLVGGSKGVVAQKIPHVQDSAMVVKAGQRDVAFFLLGKKV